MMKKEKTENEQEKKDFDSVKENLSEFKELKSQYDSIKEEYDQIQDSLKRLQAEFENFRKRTESDKSKFVSIATQGLIQKILPVLDNFELALGAHNEKSDFYKGIEMIYSQLKEVMDEEGLIPINNLGDFNPNIHEAVLVDESEETEKPRVVQVLQQGFKIGDKVIRHAKVKITKKKENTDSKKQINGGN
ncbi:nucleotide exchange factor GrpE [Candidatus Woesearchaeota archaeon]|nr:nucleotide exchange factor GrpE [Candidatus Woesearchaeota archaeon]